MISRLIRIVCISILIYGCSEHNNIDGHWHIFEIIEEDVEEIPLATTYLEFYNFKTLNINNNKGIVNDSSIFLRQYEISQNKHKQELTIHTNSKPIVLKYKTDPWEGNRKNIVDIDTLYLFSEETNKRYRGYREQDSIKVNHVYDPFTTKNYKSWKIPIISDTLQLKLEDPDISNSHLLIFPNGTEGQVSSPSLMIIANRIGSIDTVKDDIQFIIKDVKNQKIKACIDGRYKKEELKKLLQVLLEIEFKGVYVPIRKKNNENIYWAKASDLLELIIQIENNHPDFKIWDAVNL